MRCPYCGRINCPNLMHLRPLITVQQLEHTRDVAWAHADAAWMEGRDYSARSWERFGRQVQARIDRRKNLEVVVMILVALVIGMSAILIGVAREDAAGGRTNSGVGNPNYGGTLMRCATEDSVNCYWDASEQGNHQGQDVVNP